MKQCTKCLEFKTDNEFRLRKERKQSHVICRSCENKNNLDRHHKKYKSSERRKKAIRKYGLKKYYGLTEEDYITLANKQEQCCAICKEETKLFVDHDHKTGNVRGLLCQGCNSGLGFFKDDRERIRRSLKYLDL